MKAGCSVRGRSRRRIAGVAPRDGRRAASGQALLETLVVALALLPLLLAIPLIAKYQDIRHAAIAASRTAGFECSIRFEVCGNADVQSDLLEALRRRHFSRHDRDLLTQDNLPDNAPAAERNRFWVDRQGDPLLGRFADVSLQVRPGSSDAIAGAWSTGGRSGVASALSNAAGPGAFGLGVSDGLLTIGVSARVSLGRTLEQWLRRPDGLGLTLTGRTAVIVDAWNASAATGPSARTVQSRVDAGRRLPSIGDAMALLSSASQSAPAGALGEIGGAEPEDAIDLLYAPIRFLITGPLLAPVEPRGRLFRYHEVDVDLVPEDRLPGGSSGGPGAGPGQGDAS